MTAREKGSNREVNFDRPVTRVSVGPGPDAVFALVHIAYIDHGLFDHQAGEARRVFCSNPYQRFIGHGEHVGFVVSNGECRKAKHYCDQNAARAKHGVLLCEVSGS
jgi:hypothetical protein